MVLVSPPHWRDRQMTLATPLARFELRPVRQKLGGSFRRSMAFLRWLIVHQIDDLLQPSADLRRQLH